MMTSLTPSLLAVTELTLYTLAVQERAGSDLGQDHARERNTPLKNCLGVEFEMSASNQPRLLSGDAISEVHYNPVIRTKFHDHGYPTNPIYIVTPWRTRK